MVGDEDQSIYGFRAAYPQALLDFKKNYKNAKILLMETNYRSTPQILNTANKFIKQNKNRKDKNIIPFKPAGEEIQHNIFENIDEQYEYILEQVKNNKQRLAILYRNNDSSIPIVDLFYKNNLNFTIKESDANFFSHQIVVDIQDFIKFYLEPNNIENFKKIYYKINCGISKVIMQKLEIKISKSQNSNVLNTLIYLNEVVYWQRKKLKKIRQEFSTWSKKNTYEIIKAILKNMEYEKYLKKHSKEQKNNFQKLNVIYSLAKNSKNIQDFLDKLLELENKLKKGENNNQGLILSTIHGSKGLEYDRVLLIDAMSGIIPMIEKPGDENTEDFKEYEEEVRLFYVAITRAKSKLEILTYKKANDEEVEESPFVRIRNID